MINSSSDQPIGNYHLKPIPFIFNFFQVIQYLYHH
jgi:hypothetical protein